MSRQGNRNPADDKLDGLVGGAIFLSLIPFLLLLNLSFVLKHFDILTFVPGKKIIIIFIVSLMVINFLFFRNKKRYIKIHDAFDFMSNKRSEMVPGK